MRSRTKARLYYDADCGFCRWSLAWVLRLDRKRRLRPLPIESADGDRDLGDLGEARFDSWHLVRGEQRSSGGRAVVPLLKELGGGRSLVAIARRLEFGLVHAYCWVADHRVGLTRLIPRGSKERADAIVERRRAAALAEDSADART